MLNIVMTVVQLWLLCIMGMYFHTMLKNQKNTKSSIHKDAGIELEKLRALQKISLTEPLSEKTRPKLLEEIVGQKDGIKALKAALCSKNPQHVIIYGPPGVGKTAAARTVLKEAIANGNSPFSHSAKFIEMDATTLRFDERSIADPLMGSVHDPIYQGAGSYGPAGIPQPKPGAVTRAHGGVLFLDEIGEMHPVQMNKLLKVLEDRKVFFESAYYAKNNRDIPLYIHEIFQKGMPADFRLVAATTSQPEEIPPALRSRCTEIYFQPLKKTEIIKIAKNAATKGGFNIGIDALKRLSDYADNGRDAVNMVQTAGSCVALEGKSHISLADIEWVAESAHLHTKTHAAVENKPLIGTVNGLAVYGANQGTVMKIEASATPCKGGCGKLRVTGIVESETLTHGSQALKRSSTVSASIENALTVLSEKFQTPTKDYHIHLNFPGGQPIDGPSAGIAIFTALYSAIHKIPVFNNLAFTGELSIFGNVLPVGGVTEKINAAKDAGVNKVYIPAENYKNAFSSSGITVESVNNVEALVTDIFHQTITQQKEAICNSAPQGVLSAEADKDTQVIC